MTYLEVAIIFVLICLELSSLRDPLLIAKVRAAAVESTSAANLYAIYSLLNVVYIGITLKWCLDSDYRVKMIGLTFIVLGFADFILHGLLLSEKKFSLNYRAWYKQTDSAVCVILLGTMFYIKIGGM